MSIDINDLADVIARELETYTDEVTENVKKAIDTVAKETNDVIKSHVTFTRRTDKYLKAFKIKKSYEDKYNKRNTWHVANGQHRLTHLLEKGHALKGGGRARAFPHIQYGEEFAKERLEELVEEAIENA